MPDNRSYRAGAVWRTRTKIPTHLDTTVVKEKRKLTIPKDEYVLLLAYYMNRNFSEHLALLWNGIVVFAFDVDTAYQFDIDPRGYNTKEKIDDDV